MRRALGLWWTPLAARSSCVAFSSPTLLRGIAMPIANSLYRVVLRPAACRNIVSVGGSKTVDAWSTSRPCRARKLLQRLSSISRASIASSQDMSTPNEPTVDKEMISDGIESAASAAAKRRASSRYIPSDYRGVLGGPKGKWKARIVSKGGLRQLGTFGSELDAARAYNRAAQALHGSAAKLNLLPDEEITVGHKPEKTVLCAASAETLGVGDSARGVVPDAQECAAASGPLAPNETQRHGSVAPAFPAVYGTDEGKARTSSATAAGSRVSGASRDDNTVAARNSTSSLKGAGATAGTDDRIEVHGVDARSVSTAELANGTAVDVDIDVGVGFAPGNRGSGVDGMGSGRMDMIAVDPVGTDSSVMPELDFRDLEEIPVSTGPSLWEDSASSRFVDENNGGGVPASIFSFGQATNPLVKHDPSQQELAATNLNLEDGAGVGNVAAEEAEVTEAPSSMLLHDDEPRALSPSPREVHDMKRPAAAVMTPGVKAIPDASSASPAERARVYLESSPSESAPTERQVVGAGADSSSTSRPQKSMDGLGSESTAVDVAVLPHEGAASSDNEAVHGESDVHAMHGAVSVAGGDGSEEDGVDAWISTSPSTGGVVGWEWDEAGEDLYEEKLKGVVDVSTGLDRYWMEPLLRLTKPETRKVATKLSSANKLGYVSSRGAGVGRGSLLEFVLKQKEQHPTKVLLTRVGEFYETYGVDAVMMMQHAGLNKMGQEIRAGCPRKNVQQTLDGLTGAGLTVAIYEEVNDVDAQRGPSAKARIKERFLSQVVSPGSPNYLYEGCLRTDDISFRESKPYVGVMKDSSGYLLCQIYTDEREISVSERMTEEAVRVALEEAGVAEPVFDQGTGLSFLPDHTEQLSGFPSAAFPGQVLARVARLLELAQSDLEHFRTVTRIPEGRPRPVYPSTALQIGLLRNPNVPDLVPCLLPAGYPAACHRFLRKWLLLPPPFRLADSAHQLCRRLASHEQVGLPPLHAVPVGKAKALLLDRQCNVPFFREIHQCVRGMLDMLGDAKGSDLRSNYDGRLGANANVDVDVDVDVDLGGSGEEKYSALLPHLLELVAYHSGVEAVEDHLRDRAKAIIRSIEDVVAPSNGSDDISFDPAGLVPDSFWRCNEASFRGSLSLDHEATRKAYDVLNQAVSRLCLAVKEDFPNAPQDLTFDFHNNGIYLTKLPPSAKTASTSASSSSTVVKIKSKADSDGGDGTAVFVHPHDRNGKLLSKRFTTKRVSEALSVYLTAVQETESTVKLELQALSDVLVQGNDLPVIAQAAHWSVICQSMEGHVRRSLSSTWSLPSLKSLDDPDMSMQVENLVPYWLPRGEAVPNSFDFRGLFLLTAPNMSGKSTLMRSVLACSLLANAGLFVPCTSAAVPRFDGFFLRTASYDVPAEDKSAFALEMDDVRVMLRDSSRRSLALVDELGKGTSARDGAALAGALLEEMDRVSITGIFATHLHELFDLPLKTSTLSHKRMGIDSEDSDNPKWTYTMEDGMCTNSLALQTAKKYNIPGRVIARAEALSVAFDNVCRGRRKIRNATSRRGASGHDEKPRVQAANTLGGGDNDGQAWWPSDGRGWGGNRPGGVRSMADAAQVVSRITGRAEADIVSVDSGHGSPPTLEGRSCLYVLRCAAFAGAPDWGAPPDDPAAASLATSSDQTPSAAEGAEDGVDDLTKAKPWSGELLSESSRQRGGREPGGVWFYVGETDAIRERLKQHSKRWGGGTGSDAGGVCRLDAIVMGVDNRSEARRLETAVIRAMKEDGFYLVSDRDGSRTHFSSASPVTRSTPPRLS